MATNPLGRVVRHLRRAALLLHDGGGLTDGQLLESFLTRREEAAFEALVKRHGPMVLGVCRRVLGNAHDAEDAFQATFLILARKAASIRPRGMVGNWLYGVAYRTALEGRVARARRKAKEGRVIPLPGTRDLLFEAARREEVQFLDQEISRLPDKYRAPIVLCDLEGKTRKEAARLVGCPEATLSTRLLRARKLLARRLSGRGLACVGGTLAVVLSEGSAQATLPVPLVTATIQAATAVVAGRATAAVLSAPVAALAEGVLKAMLLSRLKALAEVVVLVGLLVLGTGLRPRPVQAERPEPPAAVAENLAPEGKGPATGRAENLRQLEAVKWNLLRVEVEGRTLHVADVPAERSWGRDSAEQLLASAGAQLSLRGPPVAKDAKITLDGAEVPLKDLHAGINLSLKFAEDRPIVTAIEATMPPRAGYVVKEVNAGQNTIVVTRGQDDKPLVLPVAWDALLIGVPALKDVKAVAHVALHVEVEGGKMTVKQLRVR